MPNSFTNLIYHVVFGTGDRRSVLGPAWRDELCRYIGGMVRRRGGVAYEVAALPDHVHVLASLKADPSVAAISKSIKAGSSKWMKERGYVRPDFRWKSGYDAFSVGQSRLERVRRYVRNQEERHRTVAYHEEIEEILRRYPSVLRESGYHLVYHLVFGTKYRLPMILGEWKHQLYGCVRDTVERQRGTVFEINGMSEHIHLLAGFRAEPSVSTMLRLVKTNSSKWLNESGLTAERFGWQVGYSAFTVSASQLPAVRRYIQRQEEHHAVYSFDAEMRALLRRPPSPVRDALQ